jgi:hypothetical protein
MLITTGSCCCNAAPFLVYTASLLNGDVWEINGNTGDFRKLISTLNRVYDIACDPTTGRLYVLDNPAANNATLYCFDSEGNAIWNTGVLNVSPAYNVAVSPDGHVYVAIPAAGNLRKFRASDGVEITTGNWPYTPPEASFFYTVATDRNNDIYIGGVSLFSPDVTKRAAVMGLTSAGVRKWRTNITNTSGAVDNDAGAQIVYHLDAFNGEVQCQRQVGAGIPTLKSHYIVNGTTGVIGASYREGTTGQANNLTLRGCAYGPLGDDYAVQLPGVAGGYVVLKNLAHYYTNGSSNSSNGVAISRQGDEIILLPKAGSVLGCIYNVLQNFYVDIGETTQTTIESSHGRNGPFNT